MTRQEIEALVTSYGLKIDGKRQGAGKFADLEMGIGADTRTLANLQRSLANNGVCSTITHCTNPDHPDFRKTYLEVPSFWDE